MRVLDAGSTIVQREQNLFSGEREVAKAHAGGVVQCDANGRHNRRQQGLADAVEVRRSSVFQRARVNLPWNIREGRNVIIAQVGVDDLAMIVVNHFLE